MTYSIPVWKMTNGSGFSIEYKPQASFDPIEYGMIYMSTFFKNHDDGHWTFELIDHIEL